MAGAIAWGIIWAFAALTIPTLLFYGSTLAGAAFTEVPLGKVRVGGRLTPDKGRVWPAPVGVAAGIVLATGWFIFAVIQSVQCWVTVAGG